MHSSPDTLVPVLMQTIPFNYPRMHMHGRQLHSRHTRLHITDS